jgi:hypothetical protein
VPNREGDGTVLAHIKHMCAYSGKGKNDFLAGGHGPSEGGGGHYSGKKISAPPGGGHIMGKDLEVKIIRERYVLSTFYMRGL